MQRPRPKRSVGALIVLCLLSTGVFGLGPGARAQTACSEPSTAGGDWPTYGRDLANSRHQELEGELGPAEARTLAPAWTFSADGAGGAGDFTGTPVVAGGCVFVGSNMGWVFAADADTGEPVWSTKLVSGGVVNSTLAVSGNRVFAYVSREGSPYVAALSRDGGGILWETTVDTQPGADAFASPVVFDGVVLVGVSGDAAQHGEEGERITFKGSYVLLDAVSGTLLHKEWTIPPEDWDEGFAGATVSTPAAVDRQDDVAYVGTGSSFRPQKEHPNANALLKIDLDREAQTFGEILAAYKGDTFDDVVPGYSDLPCVDLPLPPPPPIVPAGRGVGACGEIDTDFAAAPNLVASADGGTLVTISQKSGTFHAVDADTMEAVWTQTFGPPQPFGGVSAAFDGSALYGAAAAPGYAFSLGATDGSRRWLSPIGDAAHYGVPVSSANGVVYTLDTNGFLDAYEAATGAPLLHRPIRLGSDMGADALVTFGGVSIARNTAYAAVGMQHTGLDFTGSLNGYVVAFRPTDAL